jgi:outer membrane protein
VPEVERLFTMALERRPELAAGLAAIRAGEFGVDAAHTTSAPSLGAGLAYNRRGLSSFEFDTLFLTLSIAFEAYDGGLTAGRVKEAEAQLIAAKAQLDGTRRRVLSDVATAYLDLKTAEQRLEAAEAAEINARETVRLSEGRYKAGLGIFLDVLDAQAQLLLAETNRVNAVAARAVARAALARAVGMALEMVKENRN